MPASSQCSHAFSIRDMRKVVGLDRIAVMAASLWRTE